MFSSGSYLPPNTSLKIRYRRSPSAFYTLANGDSADLVYKFVIEDMYLRIPSVRIMPQIAPHLEKLREDVNPRLYFDNFLVKNYPIPADSQTRTFSAVFTGNLPKLMYVAFFDEDNFVGKNNLDPFFTSSEPLKDLTVITNGITSRKFTVDLKKQLYSDAYKAFVDAVGASGKAFSIAYESWGSGNSFFAFDFLNCDPTRDGESCNTEMIHQGSIDFEMNWSEKTTKPQVMLIFSLTTDSVELLKDGKVILNRVVV
jgi:hypothetical protein